jgi:hypothetical protein
MVEVVPVGDVTSDIARFILRDTCLVLGSGRAVVCIEQLPCFGFGLGDTATGRVSDLCCWLCVCGRGIASFVTTCRVAV